MFGHCCLKKKRGIRAAAFLSAVTLLWIAGFFASSTFASDSSWFINENRFHVSFHGRLSCTDCHGDVADAAFHPDPELVTKAVSAFFSVDQCTECHDNVTDDINEGQHGGVQINDPRNHMNCISCHDPHSDSSEKDIEAYIKPGSKQCGTCHEKRDTLPSLSSEDETCMACHRLIDPKDPKATQKMAGFCFHCHERTDGKPAKSAGSRAPLIDVSQYTLSPHAKISCMECHPNSTRFGHVGKRVACLECHMPHHEKVAHDIHSRVTCEACHIPDAVVVREHGSGNVLWRKGKISKICGLVHSLSIERKEESCHRCHFSGNRVGAASMVLPPKSIMCMPCHAATFSAGDKVTLVSLTVFLFGFFNVASVGLSGTLGNRNAFRMKLRIIPFIRTLFLDALLQRRLYQQSRGRWIIHALIFFPFVFRFTWGMVALCTSLWVPEWSPAWKMLDKNDPANAFLFDLTGIMVITGAVLAVVRKTRDRKDSLPNLPKPDWPAYGLLAGILVVGFILEGMRISMTGSPEGASYAFLGYLLSRLFIDTDLTGIYGYIWYLHAIFTGAFVVYLPFSSMFHMIMAPVSLAIRALSKHEP